MRICSSLASISSAVTIFGLSHDGLTATKHATTPIAFSAWVTTADGARKLEPVTLPLVSSKAKAKPKINTVIQIDDQSKAQEIDGFGAALTESSAWLIQNKLSPQQRAKLLARLFDAETGIGLSMLRHTMGASDFSLSEYSYDDVAPGEKDPDLKSFSIAHDQMTLLPTLKQIFTFAPDLKIIASPWSPPAWMKTNSSLAGGELLDPEAYAPFAQYFVKFIEAYKAEGIPIHSLTVQNEPLHESDYPSMRMEWWQQANFIRYHLAPALDASGLKPKILLFDHNWADAHYARAILADSQDIEKVVSGAAFHCYQGSPDEMKTVRDAFPDKEIHVTECSSGNWVESFESQLDWETQNLLIGSLSAGSRSILKWNLVLDENNGPVLPGSQGACKGCQGLATIRADGSFELTSDYYILGHVSKFIRPGARKIAATFAKSSGLSSIAFENPDGSKILLLRNPGPTQNVRVMSGGKDFSYDAPGNSLSTLKW